MLPPLPFDLVFAQEPTLARQSPLPTLAPEGFVLDAFPFSPELVLCGGIVLLLLVRLVPLFDRRHTSALALLISLLALGLSVCQWTGWSGMPTPEPNEAQQMFGGMLIHDRFAIYLRCFLYVFASLIIWLSITTGIPDRDDSADFYVLLLGATLGMALMAMANHLMMVFIAIEMASLPSYALAGFLKGKRQSSEAALKYVVYGGGAAGIMLYGISLLAGKFGTGYMPDLAAAFVRTAWPPGSSGVVFDPILVLGTLFVLVGVGFKLAVVPFHFWCPDVFEGASAEVAGFLSVASKGAALALLARIVFILGGLDSQATVGHAPVEPVAWMALVRYLVPALAFIAALTATFGNLAAYSQNNLKRLLAYSTIAHAGYMLMGLAVLRRSGAEAVLFYLAAYLVMNLGAFAVVAYLRNQTGSEDLDSFRGLVRRSPFLVVVLCFFLLSLLGIPPLIGFMAKFQIFSVLYNEGRYYTEHNDAWLGTLLYGLLVIGGINTVLSAVYYLKVMRVMILDRLAEDLEGREPVPLRPVHLSSRVYAGVLGVAVVALGILWGPLDQLSREGAGRFSESPGLAARPNQPLRGPGGRPPKMDGPKRP